MTEEFVSYEQALRLKECGFDWEVNHVYKNPNPKPTFFRCLKSAYINGNEHGVTITSAPTQSLAQRWLREVKGIYVFPDITCTHHWFAKAIDLRTLDDDVIWDGALFPTYEAAMSHGLTAILRKLTENQ